MKREKEREWFERKRNRQRERVVCERERGRKRETWKRGRDSE